MAFASVVTKMRGKGLVLSSAPGLVDKAMQGLGNIPSRLEKRTACVKKIQEIMEGWDMPLLEYR